MGIWEIQNKADAFALEKESIRISMEPRHPMCYNPL